MEDLLRYNGADWAGFALTLGSLHMLGGHRRTGFLLGAAASVAWACFSYQAESTATLIANGVFFTLNLRGWLKWRPLPQTAGDVAGDSQ
jgi:hypothetical protein